MKISRIIFSSFLSLSLLLSGCYMSKYNSGGKIDLGSEEYKELRPFGEGFEKALYKASLTINDHTFSGLMMIKRFSSESYKVAFFNELGMNFFDFELKGTGSNNKMQLVVNSIYSILDRKMLIKSFEKYFSMLLSPGLREGIHKTFIRKDGSHALVQQHSYKGKDAYLSKKLITPYTEIVNISSLRKHERILISLSEEQLNQAPKNILIEQPGLRIRFELNQGQ